MNLRALQYFVKLADIRHFSKAADACFVSQPTLSTQIKKLEEELGTQLVERSPKNIMLTPVGEEIAERARKLLADVEQIRAVARRSSDPAEGNLRLGLFPTLAPYLLPHVVPGLRHRFPRLRLQLTEEKTEMLLRMLHRGELDAALLALPIPEAGLQIEILFREPFLLALPAHHELAQAPEVSIDDLHGNELLLLEEGHCLREHALEVCTLAGAHERVDFHASSMETLRQMVAAEVGITLMPKLAVMPPIAATDNLVTRPFSGKAPSRTIALAWRSSSALSGFHLELSRTFRELTQDLLA
ncbi:MAG TPA: LysR substrate-binding domain-containing protein [Xanthomonadales bacterium]|nr:LysR substrate-binding domain-containing protein [Xanthomonadales bacterium]